MKIQISFVFFCLLASTLTFDGSTALTIQSQPKQDECLTPEQKQQLETSVNMIEQVLEIAADTLQKFADQADGQTKAKLEKIANVVKVVDTDIAHNISKIAQEACGSCGNVVQAVKDGVKVLEQSITDIEPEWKDEMIYKEIVIAISAVLNVADDLCQDDLRVILAESDCLTPQQQKDLETAVKVMKSLLSTAVASLDVAIAAEKDEQIKQQLIEARKIIIAICQDVVGQLVAIGEEACGSCDAIVKTITDSIHAIEKAISDIGPDFAKSQIYKSILTAIESALEIATNSCPQDTNKDTPSGDDDGKDCLSAKQESILKVVTKGLDQLFELTVIALDVAAAAEMQNDNQQTADNLRVAAKSIRAFDQQVIKGKLDVVTREASCGDCDDIVKAISDIIHALEGTLESVLPEWKDSPIFKAVQQSVDELLEVVDSFCDNSNVVTKRTSSVHVNNECLSPDQKEQLKEVVHRMDQACSFSVVALRIAATAVDDEPTKEKLQLAAKIIDAIDEDVVKTKLYNLTLEGSCGDCDDVVKTVNDGINALEDVLDEVLPDWRSNEIFNEVDRAIKLVLPFVERMCQRQQNRPEPIVTSL